MPTPPQPLADATIVRLFASGCFEEVQPYFDALPTPELGAKAGFQSPWWQAWTELRLPPCRS